MIETSTQLDELVLLINQLSNEKQKRILLASAAKVYGHGGIGRIKELTGIAYSTIHRGSMELENGSTIADNRIRRTGAGRKTVLEHNPEITQCIEEMIEGSTYGDPSNVLHWIPRSMSLRKIADTLLEKTGYSISHEKILQLLGDMGYSKQVNQKMIQNGIPSPHRDEQFQFINDTAKSYMDASLPVISVDTKKKENVGNFKNNGAEYRKRKDARKVFDHDFPIKELGKVSPYGVYVLNNNTGFINLGTDHDTAEFAVESIRRWWNTLGRQSFPLAEKIYITCDGGGSNGSRCRYWKYELQEFADESGLEVMISHYPPGTSKWNKIEHRMFCYISKNWQGHPLINIETIVDLITATTTENGLKIDCQVDNNAYATGRKITDEELSAINLYPCDTLGSWNYVIKPQIKH